MSYAERLTPTHRIASCEEPGCSWTASLRRKNGAWMTLKKMYRLHWEQRHATKEGKKP